MGSEFRPRHRSGIRVEEIESELVLFDPELGKIAYLNQTAGAIWQLCDGSRTTTEICQLVAAAMQVNGETVAEDTRQTIAEFERAGLVMAGTRLGE